MASGLREGQGEIVPQCAYMLMYEYKAATYTFRTFLPDTIPFVAVIRLSSVCPVATPRPARADRGPCGGYVASLPDEAGKEKAGPESLLRHNAHSISLSHSRFDSSSDNTHQHSPRRMTY